MNQFYNVVEAAKTAAKCLVIGVVVALFALAIESVADGGCPGGVCPTQQAPQWQGVKQTPRPFVCRIYNHVGRETSIGSGTLVAKGADYGAVVTCAHLFNEGDGRVSVRFPGGTNYSATVIAKNRQHDLAFVKITPRPTEPIARMASDYAKQGARVTHAGYGKDGRYMEVSGSVIGYHKWNSSGRAEVLDVTGGSRQGDSGGPILNVQGELVGVLATTDGKSTQGIFNGRICAFAMENRYVFPWNADLAAKKDKNKLEANRPVAPIVQQPIQQAPPVDLSSIKAAIVDLQGGVDANTNRLAPLEATADKARQLADQWPELQAALQNLERVSVTTTGQANRAATDASKAMAAVTTVAGKAAETQATVDAALDEDAPTGLMGKLKARLDDRIETTVTGKVAAFVAEKAGWSMPAALGATGGVLGLIAIGLVFLGKREVGKAGDGDQILAQRLAALTPNTRDDAIADKLAVMMAKLDEKIDTKRGK